MATANIYFDTRRALKNGKYPIRIRIQHVGKFYLTTEFSAYKEEWTLNGFSRTCDNYKNKNVAIRNLINRIELILFRLDSSGELKRMSDKQLHAYLNEEIEGTDNRKVFIDYLDEFVSTKTNSGTISLYYITRNKIIEYDKECTLESIDVRWLTKFECWMKESGMKINAYAIHLRNIRAVFNYCLDNEYTNSYPFRRFQIKKEATRKRSLTVEQLRTLRDYPCEEYQERYRDIFMLMFYLIGINAADLFMARKNAIVNGRLEYRRAKTGRLYSILIHPEAMDIINKYRGKNYLLNIMDEYTNHKNFLHRMGIALKQIGDLKREGRGGKKVRQPLFPDLSSYLSRHTWATIASSLDIPKDTIAAALGHGGNTVTDIYIDFDEKKVDEANRKVIDYVNML